MTDIFKKVVTKLMNCMNPKSKKNRRKRANFQDMPTEMVEEIFGYQTPYDLITNVYAAFCDGRIKEIIIKMFSRKFNQPPWNQKAFANAF